MAVLGERTLDWFMIGHVGVDAATGATDHELMCTRCGEHVCDIELGVTIGELTGVIERHICNVSRLR